MNNNLKPLGAFLTMLAFFLVITSAQGKAVASQTPELVVMEAQTVYLTNVEREKMSFSPASVIVIVLLAVPTLLLGVFFQPIVNWASRSAQLFLGM